MTAWGRLDFTTGEIYRYPKRYPPPIINPATGAVVRRGPGRPRTRPPPPPGPKRPVGRPRKNPAAPGLSSSFVDLPSVAVPVSVLAADAAMVRPTSATGNSLLSRPHVFSQPRAVDVVIAPRQYGPPTLASLQRHAAASVRERGPSKPPGKTHRRSETHLTVHQAGMPRVHSPPRLTGQKPLSFAASFPHTRPRTSSSSRSSSVMPPVIQRGVKRNK